MITNIKVRVVVGSEVPGSPFIAGSVHDAIDDGEYITLFSNGWNVWSSPRMFKIGKWRLEE